MAAVRLTVRIDGQLRSRLRAMSRRRKKRESEVVREALEAYCRADGKLTSCYDMALQAGFMGSAKNALADLSSNPKYLEGFGRIR